MAKIIEGGMYSTETLTEILGISRKSIEQAADAGQIQGHWCGADGRILFKGADVTAWLGKTNPAVLQVSQALPADRPSQPVAAVPAAPQTEPVRQAPPRVAAQSTGNDRLQPQPPISRVTTMTTLQKNGPATQRFNALVGQQMEQGKTRPQAVEAVVRADPDLHRQFLMEANADRPTALRTFQNGQRSSVAKGVADPIQRFEQAVTKKVQAGASRRDAIAQVVREDQDLHQAYLAAYNEQRGRRIIR